MNLLRLTLSALLLLVAPASCTIEQGYPRPRKTDGAYAVFRTIDNFNRSVVEDIRLVMGLNLYLAQTTDAGREAVCRRFFDWAEVSRTDTGGWMLAGVYWRYEFELLDDLKLGAEGAVWTVRMKYADAVWRTLTLTTEGRLVRCRTAVATPDLEEAAAEWLIRLSTVNGVEISAQSGDGTLLVPRQESWGVPSGSDTEVWTVRYRFEEPCEWGEGTRQHLSATAQLTSPEQRLFVLEAVEQTPGVIVITCDGISEEWRR